MADQKALDKHTSDVHKAEDKLKASAHKADDKHTADTHKAEDKLKVNWLRFLLHALYCFEQQSLLVAQGGQAQS